MDILLNKVSYIYEGNGEYDKQALNDISLRIGEGEFVGIIGHTGSGKSTLIRLINGLLRPTSGGVYIDGEDISDKTYSLKKLRQRIGIVFQYPEYQLFEKSVIEDVKYGPTNMGLDKLHVEYQSYEALKSVGIKEEQLDMSPFLLSGGEKRRVAIAGVLAMDPEVLILDEPTAGLDPAARDEILSLLDKLYRDKNKTIILITHSMEDIARLSSRIVVLDNGSIMMDGTAQEIFSRYKELERIGLRAPEVTYVIEELVKRGITPEHNAINIEQAVDAIMGIM